MGATYLTPQELACVRLWLRGATFPDIAKILGLSMRTVETYMMRLRQRTGHHARLDIEQMLLSSGVV